MRLSPVVPVLAVLAGTTLLLSACDDDLTRTDTPALLVCSDLAVAIDTEATVTGGDEQRIALGNHLLEVPAEAIPQGVAVQFIIAQVPSEDVRLSIEVESEVEFESDLTLTLSYAGREGCTIDGVPVADATDLSVYNLDTAEWLPRADAGAQAVAGTTRSFSTFVIAH